MQVATQKMIDAAIDLISNGRPPRSYVELTLRASHGATHGQADDAVRAARHAVKFSTLWLS